MLNHYQNITQKYCQETHYNYVKNSGFGTPDCFFLCSPLLHYHYVSTSLTMQIPAETLSQTHRACFTQRQVFPTSERGTMIRIF
jgi:hypothetical protein